MRIKGEKERERENKSIRRCNKIIFFFRKEKHDADSLDVEHKKFNLEKLIRFNN
jgi:hypothetical protein